MNGNSGRHTQPPVESLERYIRHRWAAIHADDVVTDEEERDLVLLDAVLDDVARADATQEAINALGHRQGIDSQWAQRRLRELRMVRDKMRSHAAKHAA